MVWNIRGLNGHGHCDVVHELVALPPINCMSVGDQT
jgi:hypothetical protein